MKEKTRKVLEYADQGLTVPQISELTGVKKKSIYKYLYKYKGCISAKVNDDKDAVLIDLRNKGLTYTKIAKITGRDRSDIGKRCRQLGIAYNPIENHSGRKQEEQFAEELKSKDIGIVYVSGYINNNSNVIVHKTTCGHEFEWNASNLRKHDYINGVQCPVCVEIRKEQEQKEREISKDKRTVEIKGKSRIDKYLRRREETGKCEWCGALFRRAKGFGNVQRIYCSEICFNDMKKEQKKKYRKDERLKKCGRRQWNISLKRLYARDKGICWLCGKPTDMNDFRKDVHGNVICGESYPSIDHVVPVSRGGDHTWDNIRLAHRGCNSKRGAPSVA